MAGLRAARARRDPRRRGHRRARRPLRESQARPARTGRASALPRREDAVVHGQSEEGHLPLLRLRRGRRRLRLPHAPGPPLASPRRCARSPSARASTLPEERRAPSGRFGPRGAAPRLMDLAAPASTPTRCGSAGGERARAYLDAARHRARGRPALRSRLGARGLGRRCSARMKARGGSPRTRWSRPGLAVAARERAGRLRSLPRPAALPHPRSAGPRRRLRRARASATSSRSTSTRPRRRSTCKGRPALRRSISPATTIRERNRALVVEGYVDCLMAHQHGFTETVAALGTAFTAAQLGLLRRYCDEVVTFFDADAAGQKAAERAEELLEPTATRHRRGRVNRAGAFEGAGTLPRSRSRCCPPATIPDTLPARRGRGGLRRAHRRGAQPPVLRARPRARRGRRRHRAARARANAFARVALLLAKVADAEEAAALSREAAPQARGGPDPALDRGAAAAGRAARRAPAVRARTAAAAPARAGFGSAICVALLLHSDEARARAPAAARRRGRRRTTGCAPSSARCSARRRRRPRR